MSELREQLAQTIPYQGRKASRVGSEQRRRAILEAALNIVIKEGVRGVRHRAIAKAANVPLSATTYYFKDINDLISDTFSYFVELGNARLSNFWIEAEIAIRQQLSQSESVDTTKRRLLKHFTELAVSYIEQQVTDRRDELIAEQAFLLEALRSSHLRQLVHVHHQNLLKDLTRFYQLLGTTKPELDAVLTKAVVVEAEYYCLLDPSRYGREYIRAFLQRHIQLVLQIPDDEEVVN
ncbi:TetR/AcrR family transcriptional regulator [Spartinivicinus poritis]|uniref:TetR family transcriptional regulator n=1 Tax=Spartinivicinus poritis TaxID=2994640 RepID=A0ABT5U267_9GAMM|nr:TetR family transcriptional regulator [Spartinivicinus sp. A2-2]MDE1460462.1 TetR family transcriptional regulator [Spartinivicinus sp. A2-2]